MERYYARNSKTYAVPAGRTISDGRSIFYVYYDGWFAKREVHAVTLYEWARGLHGNAPSGTPYGFFRASRTGERVVITV